MPSMLFVNLPVTDLPRASRFYEAVGAARNPQFSDDTASCMVFSDTIYAMLLTHAKFAEFTTKPIPDPHAGAQHLIALFLDSRAEVDRMVDAADAAGAIMDPCPAQDLGFMYARSFEDPDGHIWEVGWMDPAVVQAPAPADA